jgi:arylsulfatase A-like enzyme
MKTFLTTLLITAASFALPGLHAAGEKPNIVVLLVDDMGIMDTSLQFLTTPNNEPVKHPLNGYYRTPNMERLAALGVRFNQFNAMSVCSPTRRSIMTGQNAARHGTTNWIHAQTNNKGKFGPPDWNWNGLRASDVTLPALLRKGGYRTIHVGKAHFSSEGIDGADPTRIGFDVNIGGGTMGHPGSYYGKENFTGKGPQRARHAVPGLQKYHGQEIFLTEALTREAVSEIDRAVKDEIPFFLYFAQYAVHSPFQSDPRFADHYKNSGKKPPAQAYATLIEGMDKSLGDLLDHLERLKIADNTLILFLGDNGGDAPLGEAEEVGSSAPLRGKKGSCYEGGVRVPFIAAWAKNNPQQAAQKRLPIAAGAIQSQLASVEDLFPTLLDLTTTNSPAGHPVDGRKLHTLFCGKPDPARPQEFLMHYPHEHRSSYWSSLRDGEWKVIHRYHPETGTPVRELYHLKADPFEQKNLAATHPDELKRMMQKLIASLEQHQAAYPVAKDGGTALKPRL